MKVLEQRRWLAVLVEQSRRREEELLSSDGEVEE